MPTQLPMAVPHANAHTLNQDLFNPRRDGHFYQQETQIIIDRAAHC